MTATLLAMLLQASAIAPPADVQSLPPLALHDRQAHGPQVAEFVRGEVRAGRCDLPPDRTTLDLAVLVSATGRVRRIVPQAIGCATVEQFAAGLVLRSTRDNLVAPATDAWFRATVTLASP